MWKRFQDLPCVDLSIIYTCFEIFPSLHKFTQFYSTCHNSVQLFSTPPPSTPCVYFWPKSRKLYAHFLAIPPLSRIISAPSETQETIEVMTPYRLSKLFRDYLAPVYIARDFWLYSQELYSQILMAI